MFDVPSQEINEIVEYAMATADSIGFDLGGDLVITTPDDPARLDHSDWRNHLPVSVISAWPYLGQNCRSIAFMMAHNVVRTTWSGIDDRESSNENGD